MDIEELWSSSNPTDWKLALQRYWDFVMPQNLELERALNALDLKRLEGLDPLEWYNFLHDEYFLWKYTARNRLATTRAQLRRHIKDGQLDELDFIRQQLLKLNRNDIRLGLDTAKKIRGLGTAGASGLLSLMYPEQYATVDQFVVKALRLVSELHEANALLTMKPENLSITNGVLLIQILSEKAMANNQLFRTTEWTPRKIDMILWTYGR